MKIYHKFAKSEAVQQFMNNSVLMNWNALNKSILILLLGGAAHITWIAWYIYCSNSDDFSHWFDHDYGVFHLARMILFCMMSFALIIPIYFGRKHLFMQRYFPYFVVMFFTFSFIYGGYSVGILSPASIAGYISLITVGLVLFERKMIYPVFIPITIYLLVAIILSLHGVMDYAPIYSEDFNHRNFQRTEFWVYTQMYFYIPIFFCSLVLFEVLLSQWRNREKKISEISQIDPLTGVFNRRKIGQDLTDLQNEHRSVAIILMDLDHFKCINDTYGHDIGDEVLKRVAHRLSKTVRGDDVVGRFGGEEFILVLQNKSMQQAIEIAERCRKELENEIIHVDEHRSIQISASFGVTIADPQMSKEMVLRQADEALYKAKKSGRNQVQPFTQVASFIIDKNMHADNE